MKGSLAVAAAVAFAASLACSTPGFRERYAALDGMEKQTFLALYPEVPPDARLSLLDRLDEAELLDRYVTTHAADASQSLQRVQVFRENPRNHRIRELEIDGGPTGPITAGDAIELHAKLRFTDGRVADATDDSLWQVDPALARMEGGKLRYGCIASDVVVSANFLDESMGVRRFEIRKPLRSLELRVAEEDVTAARGEFIRLKLLARCPDGSATDVSCQAEWSIAPPEPGEKSELVGCGVVRRPSREATHAVVTARYGGLAITRDLELPRPPGR